MKRTITALLAAIITLSTTFYPLSQASALVSSYNWRAGRIIDDTVFMDKGAMTVGQIQDFLNQKVGTGGYGRNAGQCDTNGSGTSEFGGGTRAQYGASRGNPAPFTCLKDFWEVPKTNPGPGIPANNYGGKAIPAGARSAAQLIWDASQRYSISPKVLLVTIQKESAGPLTTDDWPFERQYTYAMGAHCPDSGPGGSANCDQNYAGFSLQISESARLFRYYLDNMGASWWPYKRPGVNNVLYNPNRDCGASNISIESKATAALYTYTPYQPNQAALNNMYGSGDGCSAYGNRNFWRIYNDWFGPTIQNFDEIIRQGNYEGTQCPVLNKTNFAYKTYCTSPVGGDFNGDGFEDVALVSIYPDKRSFNLWLFPGAADGIGNPVFQQHFSSNQYWNISAIKMTTADVNNDNSDDLVMFAANAYNGITTVQLMGGANGLKNTPISRTDRQYQPGDGWLWSGVELVRQGGDFNGDGFEDVGLISMFPDKNSFNLWLFPGAADGIGNPVFQQHFSNSQYWSIGAIKSVTADLNNDNSDDLVMFAANAFDGITTVQLMGGANSLKNAPISRTDRQYQPNSGWTWSGVEPIRQGGDFNGDGFEDVALVSIYPDKRSFNLWLFPGAADGIGNPVFQQHFSSNQYWNISAIKTAATDANNDGRKDLVMFAANAYDGITVVQIMGSPNGLKNTPISRTDRQYQPNSGWLWSLIR